jgi:DNA-binding beta-propeller fold protein YncE
VADWGNNRVQVFGAAGYLRQWGALGVAEGRFNGPYGIAVDASFNVYVADVWNNRIQKFKPVY